MPEGDSIFRAARALNEALAGRTVTRFLSVYPRLTRVDQDTPLSGRRIERVDARGKHLLMWFSGDLVLRTHMRMHGSWHIYRPGERWQRPRHEMRIVIETADMHAIAFSVPVAEFETAATLERAEGVSDLGPDLLSDTFDADEAISRILAREDVEIADALLDQRAVAGIGNIYKSETLFAARVNPFLPVRLVGRERVAALIATASKFMRANIGVDDAGIMTYRSLRNTRGLPRARGSESRGARLWVYGRRGQPCRRCGTPISYATQGPNARSTYWCARCQEQAGSRSEVVRR